MMWGVGGDEGYDIFVGLLSWRNMFLFFKVNLNIIIWYFCDLMKGGFDHSNLDRQIA